MKQSDPFLDQARLRETLIIVFDHAMPACAQIEYRLVGTAAALLHGIRLPAGDIDILVKERRGVDAFGSALSPFKCLFAPTRLPEARQYYASYEVNGVEVEVSTVEVETDLDVRETIGSGPWEHFVLIPCGSYTIPTVKLELRLATELFRNRPDKYDPIIQHMKAKGYDANLANRAIEATGLPQPLQEDVLQRLEGKRQ